MGETKQIRTYMKLSEATIQGWTIS